MIKSLLGLSLMVCVARCADEATTLPPPTACAKHPNGLIVDPYDIHKFFQCAHGRVSGSQPVDCGYSNDKDKAHLVFNEAGQTCLKSGGTAPCPQPDGNFPYDKDETKFIQCTNGQGAIMPCGTGLIFLKKCGVCGFADDQDQPCPTGPPTEPPKTDKPNTDNPGGPTTAPPTVGPTHAPAVGDACPKEKQLTADATDKKKFLKCTNGKWESMTCPDGEFDPVSKGCI